MLGEAGIWQGQPGSIKVADDNIKFRKDKSSVALLIPTKRFKWKKGKQPQWKSFTEIHDSVIKALLAQLKVAAMVVSDLVEKFRLYDYLEGTKKCSEYKEIGLDFASLSDDQKEALMFMQCQRQLDGKGLKAIIRLLEMIGELSNIQNQFGKLHEKYASPNGWLISDLFPGFKRSPVDVKPPSPPLWLILLDLHSFSSAFRLIEKIDRMIEEPYRGKAEFEEIVQSYPYPEDLGGFSNPSHACVSFYVGQLGILLNEELKQTGLYFPYPSFETIAASCDSRRSGKLFDISLSAPSVKTVLWYWLGWILCSKSGIRICPECGKFFYQEARKQPGTIPRFCSKTCRDRLEQRRHNSYKKLRKQKQQRRHEK